MKPTNRNRFWRLFLTLSVLSLSLQLYSQVRSTISKGYGERDLFIWDGKFLYDEKENPLLKNSTNLFQETGNQFGVTDRVFNWDGKNVRKGQSKYNEVLYSFDGKYIKEGEWGPIVLTLDGKYLKKGMDRGVEYSISGQIPIEIIIYAIFISKNTSPIQGEPEKKPVPPVKEKPVIIAPRIKGLDSLRLAANQNDINSQVKLVETLMRNGPFDYKSLNPEDEREGIMWLKKAAENGHVESQYELAECYKWADNLSLSRTEFVSQSHEEALKWFRKSAEQGFAEAQWEVGIYYEVGYGVVKVNNEECLKWKLKAADQGDIKRQSDIAYEYEKGYDCAKKNKEQAISWYKKVVNNKNFRYNEHLVTLAKEKLKKWKVKYDE